MENFQGSIDLLKLKNACVINVNGDNGAKKGIFIPFEDNNVFVTRYETNTAKAAYLGFAAFKSRKPGKFGDTHVIKLSFNKESLSKMSEEEKRLIPIIGNMKPLEKSNPRKEVEATETITTVSNKKEDDDSLPF